MKPPGRACPACAPAERRPLWRMDFLEFRPKDPNPGMCGKPRLPRIFATVIAVLFLALLVLPAPTCMAQMVSFAALKPGSLYHRLATVLAKTVNEKTGVHMMVQPYGNSMSGMAAVNQGTAAFVLVDVNEVLFSVHGRGPYQGRAMPNLRLAATLRPVAVGLIVRMDSGLFTMTSLRGRRLPGVFPVFPSAAAWLEGILAASGLSETDVRARRTRSIERGTQDFVAGRLDAALDLVEEPRLALAGQATGGLRFIPLPNTSQALAALRTVRPWYSITTIRPAPARPGLNAPTPLLTFDLVLGVGRQVPDKIVHAVVRVLHEHREALAAGARGFGPFRPGTMAKPFRGLRYHPGAMRFYREKELR